MKYFITVKDNIIIGVGKNCGNMEITEAEYNEILTLFSEKPTAPDGYIYLLRKDLTWELHEKPVIPEEDATEEDYKSALNRMGVST